ncbi:MAG: potassium transporter TrkG [Rhizobiaceae bacterium]
MLAVLFYLACVGLFFTLSLLGPILVALLANETVQAVRLAFYILIGVFIFGTPILAMLGRLRRIPQIGRLLLMFLVWTVLPIVAALPFYHMMDMTLTDALFESFSSFTTAGATTANSVENWPQSLLFWRVLLQWLGGYLTLLTIILILAPLGVGGLTSRKSSLSIGADLRASQDRLLVFSFNLGLLYATTTALCSLGFFLTGTRAFHSVSLAMAAVSTGGFLPFDSSLDQTIGIGGQAIFALFLIVGATSVFWHRMLLKGQWAALLRHRESYSVILLVVIVGIAFAATSVVVSGVQSQAPIAVLVQGLLNAASLVATSGVQSQPGYFTLLPLVLVLFILLAGGSAFSTSGGLKHYRLGGMLVQSWNELDRLIYPNAVRSSHFGSERFDLELMKAIWSFFVAAILILAFGTIFLATTGIPFEGALTAAIAAFTTAGPVYNAGWSVAVGQDWPSISEFTDSAKITLVVLMVMGRLEIIAVIGLFSRQYWRSR